jgi:hypothetical protein
VVDLDSADAIAWAQETLPPTRAVATTRGEHWIYLGAMASANAVRTGVDIKSRKSYTRWLGPGEGQMIALPDAVTSLPRHPESAGGPVSSPVARTPWTREVATGCRHTEGYVRNGLNRGLAMVLNHLDQGAASQAFGVARFLGSLHRECPGPCGLDALGWEIIATTMSVGVPQEYAVRSVRNGFAEAGVNSQVELQP